MHLTDLSMAMQKIYQTFVALAAQLQSIHENVKVCFGVFLCISCMTVKSNLQVFWVFFFFCPSVKLTAFKIFHTILEKCFDLKSSFCATEVALKVFTNRNDSK